MQRQLSVCANANNEKQFTFFFPEKRNTLNIIAIISIAHFDILLHFKA